MTEPHEIVRGFPPPSVIPLKQKRREKKEERRIKVRGETET